MIPKMNTRPRLAAVVLVTILVAAGSFAIIASRPKREITTRSREAYAAYLEGMEASRKLYFGDARKAWLRTVALDSTCAMAWVRLAGLTYTRAGATQAREYLQRAEALANRVTLKEKLFIRLTGESIRGKDAARDSVLSEMARRYPDDTEILFMSGLGSFQKKKYQDAVDSFNRLLVRAPSMGEVYNMMGYALGELGRWSDAVEAFQKYAFVYPDQANPHDSLGELYLRTGRYEDALREFAKAASLKPEFGWAHFHSAMAYAETGRYEKALASVRAAVAVSAESPEIASWRRQEVFFEMAAGHLDRALLLATRVRDEDPDDSVGHFVMGRVHATRGETALANEDLRRMKEALEKYAKAHPGETSPDMMDNFQVNELAGEIAMAEGHPDEAVSRYCHALGKADPWWVSRRILLKEVECQVRGGHPDAAILGIREQLDVNPADPAFHYWYGEALASLGKSAAAEQEFRKTVEMLQAADPDLPLLGVATRRLGEHGASSRG